MSTDKLIATAEKQISVILAKLESDTEMVLKSIEVLDIDVTSVGDDRLMLMRQTRISMSRMPGTKWV